MKKYINKIRIEIIPQLVFIFFISSIKTISYTKSINFNTEENALSQNNFFYCFKIVELIVLKEKMSRILDSFKIIRNIRKFCIDWYIFYMLKRKFGKLF